MSFTIGTVNFLVGQASVVSTDGAERGLSVGDQILNDDVVRVAEGGEIEIILSNGEAVSLADGVNWIGADALSPETVALLQQLEPIAQVDEITGEVIAVSADGSERVLQAGDQIFADETIRTTPGSSISLVSSSGGQPIVLQDGQSWLATSDTFTPSSEFDQTTAVNSDIDALQQAILAGADPTLVGEATAAGGAPAAGGDAAASDGGGSDFVSLDRTGGEVDPNAGYGTGTFTTSFDTPEEEQPLIAQFVAPTPTTPTGDGRNVAQFTDNFVNGVEYYTYASREAYESGEDPVVSGLTGDRGEPASFSYTPSEFMVFKVGNVTIAEFPASVIQGPYLFIQDIAGTRLDDVNDRAVENIAIFLQALDSDLKDGNEQDGLQTQDISAAEAAEAFSNNIEITEATRELYQNYVDPMTKQPLNLVDSGKMQVSDALAAANIEFTAKSEMSNRTGSDESNHFESIAMQHVQDTIDELAGERTPEAFDERKMDEIKPGNGYIAYSTAPEAIKYADEDSPLPSGITLDNDSEFTPYFIEFDTSKLLLGATPMQISSEVMMDNMAISDLSLASTIDPNLNGKLFVDYEPGDDGRNRYGKLWITDESVDLAAGDLESLAFDYTLWDWTASVTTTSAAVDLFKGHLSADIVDVVESAEYSTFTINSTLAFDTEQSLTVKFAPESVGLDVAEYSDDFTVPIEYSQDQGETWLTMQVLPETYTRSDYDKPLPIFEFKMAAGSDSVMVRIPIFNDPYNEANSDTSESKTIDGEKQGIERINMLVEGENYFSELLKPGIIDDDPSTGLPIVEIDFAVVSEADGEAVLTVSLVDANKNPWDLTNNPISNDITFDYTTADLSALAGTDYTTVSGKGTIKAGDLSTTIEVPIIDDELVETTEFLKVDLSNVSTNAVLGDPEASIRIYDNDGVSVSGDIQPEGSDITYTVTLSSELPSVEKTITLTPTNSGATATKVDDYSLTPVAVTYVDGDSNTQTISVNSDGSFTLPEAVSTFQASYSTVVDNTPDGGDTPRDEVARLQVQVEYQSDDETLTVTGLGEATILDVNAPTADTVESTGKEDAAWISITLKGSDVDVNDAVETFTLSNLPGNGTLYTDAALTTVAAIGNSYTASSEELTLYFQPAENWNGQTTFDYTANDGELESGVATAKINVTPVNDAPILTVDTEGDVTEDDTTPTLTDAGTLSFTDVDTADTHTVTEAYNGDVDWSGGTLSAAQVTALTSGFTADSDSWDYSVANAAVQFLGKDETVTFSYDVTVTDDSGAANKSDTETVTITITGKNDAPTIASNSQRSFSASDSNFDGEDSVLINGFTITAGTYEGNMPTGTLTPELMTKAGSGIGIKGGSNEIDVTQKEYIQVDFGANVSRAELSLGSLAGHYDSGASQNAQINVVLFKGGVKVVGVQSFDADDSSLIIVDKKATLTIESGSGDFDSVRVFTTQGAPGDAESINSNFTLLGGSSYASNVVEGSVKEIADGSTGENNSDLTANGSFGIADVDLTDVQTLSITEPDSALGELTARISNNTTNDGVGSVSWTYSVPDAAVDYLAAGEKVEETFTIEVNDQQGGTVTQDISISINGTNDVPTLSSGRVIVSETFEASSDIESRPNGWYVERGNTFTGSSGTEWTVDAAGVEIQGNVGGSPAYEGLQHAELDSDGENTEVKLSTTFGVEAGENLSLTFAYKQRPSAEDSSDMKVTLGGKELTILSDNSGVISFEESEGVEASQSDAGNGWTLITLNYPSAESTENIELKFEGIEPDGVQDTLGAYIDDIQLVANTISSASITELEDGNPNENIATHTARGQIAFDDVDLTDAHNVSVNSTVKDGHGNTIEFPLGSLVLSNDTDNNTDGTLGWVFSVDDSDIDYLSEGQTLTQVYTLTVDDGSGGTITQDITITINGTNDAPTITAYSGNTNNANDAVYEAGLVNGSSSGSTETVATGTFTIADVEGLKDIKAISVGNNTLNVGTENGEFADLATMADSTTEYTVDNGNVVLTEFNTSTGIFTYKYTLTTELQSGDVQGQNSVTNGASFDVGVSDNGSDFSSVTVNIDVVDDAPVARSYANGVIDSNNVDRTDLGFTVKAFNLDGSDGSIGYQNNPKGPKGFGVVGEVSGASVELGANNEGSESIVVTFDAPLSSVDLVLAWQHSQEHAIIELFDGGTLVGTRKIEGGSDKIDEIGTLTADDNQNFTSIRFSAPTGGGHDYLINSIGFNQGAVQEGDTLTVTAENGVLVNDESGADGYNSSQIVGVVSGSSAGTDVVNNNVATEISGTYGKLTLNADGSYTYVSTENAVTADATDTFTYTIQDADSDLDSAVLSINITDKSDSTLANAAPVTNNVSVSGKEDTVISIPTLSGSDSDGTVASFVIKTLPANGTLYIDGTKVTATGISVSLINAEKLTFEPEENWNGDTSFTYSAVDDDGAVDESPATISISVTPTPDVLASLDIVVGELTNPKITTSDSSFPNGNNSITNSHTTESGMKLTASDGNHLSWSNGQGFGVKPSTVNGNGGFRIFNDDAITFNPPKPVNSIELGVKNNTGETVKATAVVSVDNKDYSVVWTYTASNGSDYTSTVKINGPGVSLNDEGFQTTDGKGIHAETSTNEASLTISGESFSVLPDPSNGNSSESFSFYSSVDVKEFTIGHGGSTNDNSNGFTIEELTTSSDYFVYPVALEALSTNRTDSSGNVETLNSSFTIGGLKSGDSIVFGSNILVADGDGNITIDSADLFNEINSDNDELTLRTSESLPEGYQLSLTVSSTENGQELITAKGGSADDSFMGGDYADFLSGGAGSDILVGNSGDDIIFGGLGNDTLTGGYDDDTFAWGASDDDGGTDRITDFSMSDGDVLDLSDLLTGEESPADLNTYLNVTSDGTDTTVKIDKDGGNSFDTPDQVIVLEGVNTDLDSLLTNLITVDNN